MESRGSGLVVLNDVSQACKSCWEWSSSMPIRPRLRTKFGTLQCQSETGFAWDDFGDSKTDARLLLG